MAHRTGFHVWIFGQCWWHRTIAGAYHRYYGAPYATADRQIIEVKTGALVAGRAQ